MIGCRICRDTWCPGCECATCDGDGITEFGETCWNCNGEPGDPDFEAIAADRGRVADDYDAEPVGPMGGTIR